MSGRRQPDQLGFSIGGVLSSAARIVTAPVRAATHVAAEVTRGVITLDPLRVITAPIRGTVGLVAETGRGITGVATGNSWGGGLGISGMTANLMAQAQAKAQATASAKAAFLSTVDRSRKTIEAMQKDGGLIDHPDTATTNIMSIVDSVNAELTKNVNAGFDFTKEPQYTSFMSYAQSAYDFFANLQKVAEARLNQQVNPNPANINTQNPNNYGTGLPATAGPGATNIPTPGQVVAESTAPNPAVVLGVAGVAALGLFMALKH